VALGCKIPPFANFAKDGHPQVHLISGITNEKNQRWKELSAPITRSRVNGGYGDFADEAD